jgi:homopolymeric O-antigen transport system permease protein
VTRRTAVEERAAATPTPQRTPAPASRLPERVTVIKPAARWPHLDVRELWHYRELLGRLVWRDVMVRYKQTFVGIAWAVLVPVFTTVVGTFIFGKFAKFPAGGLPYPVLVLSGTLPMQYFISSLTGSSTSLVANINLVTKVYFPRVMLPLSAVIVPIVDFLLGCVVLAGAMLFYDTLPGGPELLLAPAFMGIAVLSALAAGLVLSAINVRYRDVPYALPVVLQALPLLSGVYYAVSDIPEKWQWVLAFNPMTAVISGWRWSVLDGPAPVPGQVALGVAVAVVFFMAGLMYFRRSEPRFADTI